MKKYGKKNLLIISFFYYPDNRVGAKRFGNLVDYFRNDYKEVHVLTIPKNQIPEKDPSLVPYGMVHYAKMLFMFPSNRNNGIARIFIRAWEKYLCVLDPYISWILPAVFRSLKVIKLHQIDLIICSGPPFSAMVVGAISSLLTGKTLILDYRDPWTTHPRKFSFPFGKIANIYLEKVAVNRASAIVFCSTLMKKKFIKKFRKKNRVKYLVLTNGYKEVRHKILPLGPNVNKFRMLYTGSLYSGRGLSVVAKVLSNLMNKKIISNDNFEFIIYGKIQRLDYKLIQKFKLQDIVYVNEAIPYEHALRYMKGADILFLPSAEEVDYAIPYKLFDYLLVRRPIIAIAPKNSAVEDILKDVPFSKFCPLGNTEAIEKELVNMIINNHKYDYSLEKSYDWSIIYKEYKRLIDTI